MTRALLSLIVLGCGTVLVGQTPEKEAPIKVGESIAIEVAKNPTLSQTVTVGTDGKVSIFMVSRLKAEGLTPAELAQALEKSLAEYILKPVVTARRVESTR